MLASRIPDDYSIAVLGGSIGLGLEVLRAANVSFITEVPFDMDFTDPTNVAGLDFEKRGLTSLAGVKF